MDIPPLAPRIPTGVSTDRLLASNLAALAACDLELSRRVAQARPDVLPDGVIVPSIDVRRLRRPHRHGGRGRWSWLRGRGRLRRHRLYDRKKSDDCRVHGYSRLLWQG